jgi:hypothetical protein
MGMGSESLTTRRAVLSRKLPSKDNSADFNGPALVGLLSAPCRLNKRPIPVQFNDGAAFDQPKQAQVINAGKRPLAVAAEQVERSPTQGLRTGSQAVIEETAAVVYKAPPARQRDIARGVACIELRQAISPRSRRTAVILDDSCTLFLSAPCRPCDICDICDIPLELPLLCRN